MNLTKLVAVVLFVSVLCDLECNCGVLSGNKLETDCENSKMKQGNEVQARKKEQNDLMSQILPMLVMPFIMQTTLLPMTLISMKFMLLKSMFLGKLAIFFGIVTFLRHMLQNQGGLYSHNVNVIPNSHREFGRQNADEKHDFGATHVHKRRRRKLEL